ncbi:DnaD domain protein [Phosphitispora sp. TUW77]|uniref:DnaD domain protein n=1 Tax=Phosphitispora sp. TUW77 TaxID=3152361 RepID=UPI003AB3FAC2
MSKTRDRKGNITAAFGSDLTLEGMTGVPNLLLKYYQKIGITDSEMMLIIHLMRLQTSANQHCPSADILEAHMSSDKAQIQADLASLKEKGIISIKNYYNDETDQIVPFYCYEPLFEKISEFWACEKVQTYQQMKKNLAEQKKKTGEGRRERKTSFTQVCKGFEKEFGRILSPMEIEQVDLWLSDYDDQTELIFEALKRATLLGKHNFKYIDSILLEWQKNNLKTIDDVLTYEANYRQRHSRKPIRKKIETPEKRKDKFRLLYLS